MNKKRPDSPKRDPVLQIEVNANFKEADTTYDTPTGGLLLMVTPPLDADYFIARVKLHQEQAIVIFPKFGTIGCGFAEEEDWNTNLPISLPAEEIYSHIKKNKKYAAISKTEGIAAIQMLQKWCEANNLPAGWNWKTGAWEGRT